MGQIWFLWDVVLYGIGMLIASGIDITWYFPYLGVCPNLRAGIKIPRSSAETLFAGDKKIHLISTFYHLQWRSSRTMDLVMFDRHRAMPAKVGLKFQNPPWTWPSYWGWYIFSLTGTKPSERYNFKLHWCH